VIRSINRKAGTRRKKTIKKMLVPSRNPEEEKRSCGKRYHNLTKGERGGVSCGKIRKKGTDFISDAMLKPGGGSGNLPRDTDSADGR